MGVLLPFSPRVRQPVQRAPAQLLDDANVEAAATWLNKAYAVLEKAPDWPRLPLEGRVIRMRGLLDDEAYRIGVDRITERGWMEFVRAYDRMDRG